VKAPGFVDIYKGSGGHKWEKQDEYVSVRPHEEEAGYVGICQARKRHV
jgi:hypothetical protein